MPRRIPHRRQPSSGFAGSFPGCRRALDNNGRQLPSGSSISAIRWEIRRSTHSASPAKLCGKSSLSGQASAGRFIRSIREKAGPIDRKRILCRQDESDYPSASAVLQPAHQHAQPGRAPHAAEKDIAALRGGAGKFHIAHAKQAQQTGLFHIDGADVLNPDFP